MILKKICFMLLVFCGIVSSAANLVKNGDFSSVDAEGKPEKWGTQSWGPPLGDFILDKQNFAGKAPSLRIDNPKADCHSFMAQWSLIRLTGSATLSKAKILRQRERMTAEWFI